MRQPLATLPAPCPAHAEGLHTLPQGNRRAPGGFPGVYTVHDEVVCKMLPLACISCWAAGVAALAPPQWRPAAEAAAATWGLPTRACKLLHFQCLCITLLVQPQTQSILQRLSRAWAQLGQARL